MPASPYFSVQLQLLEACNLRCAHCYNADPPPTRNPSTAELLRRIDAIYDLGAELGVVPDMHLSGGEPTLRRDLVEIVSYVMNDKAGDSLLFTNGTRWTEKLASELWDAGLRFVQVSLEGPEDFNDAIRGQGVYVDAMDTVRMLGARGYRVTISITVTAHNFPILRDFVTGLDPLALHFHMREVLPLGAGAALPSLTPAQRKELAHWVIGWSGQSTLGLEDPTHCSVSRAYAHTRRGCVAGRNHFCVDVDGVVYPCRPLRLAVGHVSDLRAAWNSPELARRRARDFGGQGGRCEIRASCRGCRVHALADGDPFGEDTRCFAPELGLVRDPLEARAIALAERAGRGVWRLRQSARAILERARTASRARSQSRSPDARPRTPR